MLLCHESLRIPDTVPPGHASASDQHRRGYPTALDCQCHSQGPEASRPRVECPRRLCTGPACSQALLQPVVTHTTIWLQAHHSSRQSTNEIYSSKTFAQCLNKSLINRNTTHAASFLTRKLAYWLQGKYAGEYGRAVFTLVVLSKGWT